MSKLLKELRQKITDLEAKLAESENEIKALKSKEKKIQLHTKRDWFERYCRLEDKSISLGLENIELKQQLAEKDNAIENWETMYKSVVQTCHNDKREIERLNKQLAEKEKEIDEVRSNHANLVADIAYKAVNVYTAESKKTGIPTFYKIHYSQLLKIEDMENLRNYAQDKISFAVEQLEKVKELVRDNSKATGFVFDEQTIDVEDFEKLIDNQIKQLKEQ